MNLTTSIIGAADAECRHTHASMVNPSRISGDHRYGMFVVLRPSQESDDILQNISVSTNQVFHDLGLRNFTPTKGGDYHLTIASPLHVMDATQVHNLMETSAQNIDIKPLRSMLKLDTRANGGNHSFSFGASNGNPYVTLGMFNDDQNREHLANADMIAGVVNNFCKAYALFAQDTPKKFIPHVTLGRFPEVDSVYGHQSGYVAHLLEHHTANIKVDGGIKGRSPTLSERVRDTYKTYNDRRDSSIEFDRMEVLLVDNMRGEPHEGYRTVASMDLRTRNITYSPIPPCKHQADLFADQFRHMQVTAPRQPSSNPAAQAAAGSYPVIGHAPLSSPYAYPISAKPASKPAAPAITSAPSKGKAVIMEKKGKKDKKTERKERKAEKKVKTDKKGKKEKKADKKEKKAKRK